MLKPRLIFSTLMIAALIGLFYLDNWLDRVDTSGTFLQPLFQNKTYLPRGLAMLGIFLTLIALASGEVVAIFRAKGIPADRWTLGLAGVVGCLFMYAVPSRLDSQQAVAALATMMVLLFMFALLRHSWWTKRTEGAMAAGAAAAFAMIYLGLFPGFYLAIRRWHGAELVAGVILITKSCDIGAYTTGRLIGKHKLIPWLSPGKTWEGLIGGVITASLLAALLAHLSNTHHLSGHFIRPAPPASGSASGVMPGHPADFIHHDYPLWWAVLTGALLGLLGQLGDLTESLFKRDAGLKDSGKTVPGFGGLLDVFDSPIATAPLAYWLLVLAERLR